MEKIKINLSEEDRSETLFLDNLVSVIDEKEGILLIVGLSSTNLFNLLRVGKLKGLAYLPLGGGIEVMIKKSDVKDILIHNG